MIFAAAACILLSAWSCTPPQSAGTKVIYQTVEKEVTRPCPVTRPERPAPLAKPLPKDPARLLDLVVAKLTEWAGPGGYGERADAAIVTCTKP